MASVTGLYFVDVIMISGVGWVVPTVGGSLVGVVGIGTVVVVVTVAEVGRAAIGVDDGTVASVFVNSRLLADTVKIKKHRFLSPPTHLHMTTSKYYSILSVPHR